MIVWDTNIASELMRPAPDQRVWAWAETQPRVHVAAASIEEITWGLARMPQGRRRLRLESRWADLHQSSQFIVLPYAEHEATRCGLLLAEKAARGQPMAPTDAAIAATCLVRSATLATRNTKDFDQIEGLSLVNPFAPEAEAQ